ncbi:MAG: hypothetical protein JWN48_1992 [Myxococcaceae bacterium]|nr:hypothetical protein [Myxococcaceae bacterium]
MTAIISKSVALERLLHVSVGMGQMLLASFFAGMAALKLLIEPERLVELMSWTEPLPLPLIRTLGAIELLGAILVTVPAVTRTPQRIVGGAALGFLTLMASGLVIHLVRGELRMILVNLVVGALAAFVAWGRLMHEPLEPELR